MSGRIRARCLTYLDFSSTEVAARYFLVTCSTFSRSFSASSDCFILTSSLTTFFSATAFPPFINMNNPPTTITRSSTPIRTNHPIGVVFSVSFPSRSQATPSSSAAASGSASISCMGFSSRSTCMRASRSPGNRITS